MKNRLHRWCVPAKIPFVERIPPRLAVRRGAPLKRLASICCWMTLPAAHGAFTGKKKSALEKLYDTELMLGGGAHCRLGGNGRCRHCGTTNAVAALGTQAAFDAKYPDAASRPPLAVAVGDGNHSLPRPRRTGRNKRQPLRLPRNKPSRPRCLKWSW